MIIGHLPAGYVVSKLLFRRFGSLGVAFKPFIWAGALGAIAPDFDLFYFYFVDHRQHHHHTYFTHFPVVWAGMLLMSAILLYHSRVKRHAALAVVFSLNGFIHMVLDSIAGDIWWFAPWIDQSYSVFTVPALYQPWWLNFILYWTFALELAVVVWAVYLWRRSSYRAANAAAQQIAGNERLLASIRDR